MTSSTLVLAWSAIFYLTSVGAGILNKTAVSSGLHPSILSLSHLLFAASCDGAILTAYGLWPNRDPAAARPVSRTMSVSPASPRATLLSRKHWSAVLSAFWPMSLCMVLGKLATYMSYATLTMSLTHTAKSLEPLINVVVAFVVFAERVPTRLVLCLVPIVCGVGLATGGDSTFNGVGFAFALASAACKVMQNILLKRVMTAARFSFIETHMYAAATGLVLLSPMLLFDTMMATRPMVQREHVRVIVLSALAQFVTSMASYKLLSMVEHLTFTVINTLKRAAIILAGLLYFRVPVAPANAAGISLAMTGVMLYNVVKSKHRAAALAASTAAGATAQGCQPPDTQPSAHISRDSPCVVLASPSGSLSSSSPSLRV